jgi:hypothetical protein
VLVFGALATFAAVPSSAVSSRPTCGLASGEFVQWQTLSLDFLGPKKNETATRSGSNPFLDFRLEVEFFSPVDRKRYKVPGFFAGDGEDSGRGRVWRVYFTPDVPGMWRYKASFERGTMIAVDAGAGGTSKLQCDGAGAKFTVEAAQDEAPGFARAGLGRMEYVGEHYLAFRAPEQAESGGEPSRTYWLKGGTNSPEDFLAYDGFDDTNGGKQFVDHEDDWDEGDPDWDNGAGKGIIGAINYLSRMGVNSIYFLPMNIGGDGQNVWPFVAADVVHPEGCLPEDTNCTPNQTLNYDIKKLAQWEIVFRHAQNKGIALHVVLNEAEAPNKRELDDGTLGPERKLFYRELVARFAHHNALIWNISEEYNHQYDLTPEGVIEFADYLARLDVYDHPMTVHYAGKRGWDDFLEKGRETRFGIVSLQTRDIDDIEHYRKATARLGRPLPVSLDETFPNAGVPTGFSGAPGNPDLLANPANGDLIRRAYVWPAYMSGGQFELILYPFIKTNSFAPYRRYWKQLRYARVFTEALPFWEMEPDDDRVAGADESRGPAQVFISQDLGADRVSIAVYLPAASGAAMLDLAGTTRTFGVQWYDPRTGTWFDTDAAVEGGGIVALGTPPAEVGQDWAVRLVDRSTRSGGRK